jgi:hypothetical protein
MGQTEDAAAALDAGGDDSRRNLATDRPELLLRLAARAARLEATLDWLEAERMTPADDALRQAASALRRDSADLQADRLLELFYDRRIEQRDFAAANFLGLAELRLRQGRLSEARDLIQRMLRVSGEAFEHNLAAADLLLAHDQQAMAAQLLGERAGAFPWDGEARVKLAATEVRRAAGPTPWRATLVDAARDIRLRYETRVEAAHAMGETGGGAESLGSAELALIAKGPAPTAAEAEQPGYVHARLLAAEAEAERAVRRRLLQGVLALRPDPMEGAPRLAIFEDARAADDHRAALAAIEPLFAGTSYEYLIQQAPSVFDEQAPDDSIDEFMVSQFLAGRVPPERRAALASDVADSLASLDRLSPAKLIYEIASRLRPDAELQQRADAVDAELARRAENARRRPAIRDELEQSNPVHPKLEARP